MGKASVGFDPDRIRTLVSMATDSSHRVIMGKTTSSCFFSNAFDRILFIIAGNHDMHESWMSSKFGRIGPQTMELAALERMKKIP